MVPKRGPKRKEPARMASRPMPPRRASSRPERADRRLPRAVSGGLLRTAVTPAQVPGNPASRASTRAAAELSVALCASVCVVGLAGHREAPRAGLAATARFTLPEQVAHVSAFLGAESEARMRGPSTQRELVVVGHSIGAYIGHEACATAKLATGTKLSFCGLNPYLENNATRRIEFACAAPRAGGRRSSRGCSRSSPGCSRRSGGSGLRAAQRPVRKWRTHGREGGARAARLLDAAQHPLPLPERGGRAGAAV